jgi:hypothetical protein
MPEPMEVQSDLPEPAIVLGSSQPPTPNHRNGLLNPSSEGNAPSSPSPSTHQFDAQTFYNLGVSHSLFASTKTPENNSAGAHRPSYHSKRAAEPFITKRKLTKYGKATEPETAEQALELVRYHLTSALLLEEDPKNKDTLTDLLTSVKEYMNTGRINNTVNILQNQVTSLSIALQKLSNAVTKVSSASQQTTPTNPSPESNTPTSSTTGSEGDAPLASSLFNNLQQRTQNTLISAKTSARKQAADRNKAKQERRLILIKQDGSNFDDINPFSVRNHINDDLIRKGAKGPVVNTVTKSLNNNLVITTTNDYNATYLLQHEDTIKAQVQYREAKVDLQFAKIIIHGIPIRTFDSENGMELVKEEINTFNKHLNLKLTGQPYWLTTREKRDDPFRLHGSVVVSFEKEEDAIKALRNRINIAGISAKTERFNSVSPTSQCRNCCGFGHHQDHCKRQVACKICGERHATAQHKCSTCGSAGRFCSHTTPKCANCGSDHQADSKNCENRPTFNQW